MIYSSEEYSYSALTTFLYGLFHIDSLQTLFESNPLTYQLISSHKIMSGSKNVIPITLQNHILI